MRTKNWKWLFPPSANAFLMGVVFLLGMNGMAQDAQRVEGLQQASKANTEPTPPNRLDFSVGIESLVPNDAYGDWKHMTLSYFRRESSTLTWYLQGTGHDRREGQGVYGSAGAYKHWSRNFYTFTAVGGGTNSGYIPHFRADQDFNIIFGPKQQFVWVLGGSYIQFYDVHRTYLFSTGLLAYLHKWIVQYRFFYNISNPGSEKSYSQIASLGYGQEGKHWTFGTFSYGNQAYLATNLVTPEAVQFKSHLLGINHRQWLGKNWGLFGDFNYFQLHKAYDKYGGSLGIFTTF